MHYGYAVFEGIRAYRTATGATRIFKADEHFERLRFSALAMNMPYEYATTISSTPPTACWKRTSCRTPISVPAVCTGQYDLRAERAFALSPSRSGKWRPSWAINYCGIMTSSFQRPNPKGFRIEAKATGHYVNSILASPGSKGQRIR